jgi:hypothetical protein
VGIFADSSSSFTLNDAMVLANHFLGSSLQGTAKPRIFKPGRSHAKFHSELLIKRPGKPAR